MDTEQAYYTLQEVADIAQLTRRTLYAYIRQGKLLAVRIGGTTGQYRVTASELNRFMAASQSENTSSRPCGACPP
jgi:excisionase family DNA binding protein